MPSISQHFDAPALYDEVLDLLQRWCGLALIGENLAQKILILSGTAGGGKGTFVARTQRHHRLEQSRVTAPAALGRAV